MGLCTHESCLFTQKCQGRKQALKDIDNSINYPNLYPTGLLTVELYIKKMQEIYGCTQMDEAVQKLEAVNADKAAVE